MSENQRRPSCHRGPSTKLKPSIRISVRVYFIASSQQAGFLLLSAHRNQRQQTLKDAQRIRWASFDAEVDRNGISHTSSTRVTSGKAASVDRAISQRYHPLRISCRIVGLDQRFPHVRGHRSSHQEDVGMPRRRDEADAKALQVVDWIVQSVSLKLATIAE